MNQAKCKRMHGEAVMEGWVSYEVAIWNLECQHALQKWPHKHPTLLMLWHGTMLGWAQAIGGCAKIHKRA